MRGTTYDLGLWPYNSFGVIESHPTGKTPLSKEAQLRNGQLVYLFYVSLSSQARDSNR